MKSPCNYFNTPEEVLEELLWFNSSVANSKPMQPDENSHLVPMEAKDIQDINESYLMVLAKMLGMEELYQTSKRTKLSSKNYFKLREE